MEAGNSKDIINSRNASNSRDASNNRNANNTGRQQKQGERISGTKGRPATAAMLAAGTQSTAGMQATAIKTSNNRDANSSRVGCQKHCWHQRLVSFLGKLRKGAATRTYILILTYFVCIVCR